MTQSEPRHDPVRTQTGPRQSQDRTKTESGQSQSQGQGQSQSQGQGQGLGMVKDWVMYWSVYVLVGVHTRTCTTTRVHTTALPVPLLLHV